MMRGTDRTVGREIRDHPIEKLMFCNTQYLLFVNRREDIFDTLCDHTLATSRIAFHHKVVHSCRCDQGSPLGNTLPFDIRKITLILLFIKIGTIPYFKMLRIIRKRFSIAAEYATSNKRDRLTQTLYGNELNARDMAKITYRLFGHYRPFDNSLFSERKNQGKEHRACLYSTIQPQFAKDKQALLIDSSFVQGNQQSDRQIKMSTTFFDIARTEIDRDFQWRKDKVIGQKCRFDPLFCFLNVIARQAYDRKTGKPLGKSRLYIDHFCLHPFECSTKHPIDNRPFLILFRWSNTTINYCIHRRIVVFIWVFY